jgi:hypothetical protein
MSNNDSAPVGIRKRVDKGLRIEEPVRELVSRAENTKNGNSDGITVRIHSSTPSCALLTAVLESSISNAMAHAHSAMGNNFLFIFHPPH